MADHASGSWRDGFALVFWALILGALGIGLYFGLKPLIDWLGLSGADTKSDFRLFAVLMAALGFGIVRLLMSIDEKLERINSQLAQMLKQEARIIEPLSAINAHMRSIREWPIRVEHWRNPRLSFNGAVA